MKYTELEEKILKQGYENFRNELNKASLPMLDVLKKYGIHENSESYSLLKKITLKAPYVYNQSVTAIEIPEDKYLKGLNEVILRGFMSNVELFFEARINR